TTPATANTVPSDKLPAAAAPAGTQPAPVYRPIGFSQASTDLQNLLTSPVEDENGRGRSGLNMATYRASQAAQASDDLGHVAGAAVGGLVSGLIAPRSDELAIKRPYQIQQAEMSAQAAAAADKEQRAAALNEAEIDLK